jgi:hypothetical protein
MLSQNKKEEVVGWMRVKKKEKAVSILIIAWCYSVLTLLDYMEGLNTVTLQPPEKFILL